MLGGVVWCGAVWVARGHDSPTARLTVAHLQDGLALVRKRAHGGRPRDRLSGRAAIMEGGAQGGADVR